jgi:cysteine-rich repeat protein
MKARLALLGICLVAPLAGCKALLATRQPAGQCGDGVVQADQGEACDDGNKKSGDGCSSACGVEVCGNGTVDPGEQCDLGQLNDNSGDCTRTCTRARCGDGHLKTRGTTPYEICDDGNNNNGDGCNPQCDLRGRVTVIAGTPGGKGTSDGVGPAARFGDLWGLASDGAYLYLGDQHGCTIRRMEIGSGKVETIAGTPGDCSASIKDGPGTKATLSRNPKRLALLGSQLYIGAHDELRRLDLSSAAHQLQTCGVYPEPKVGITAMAADPAKSVLYVAGYAGIHRVKLPCSCTGAGGCSFELYTGTLDSVGWTDGDISTARFRSVTGLSLNSALQLLYIADGLRVRQLDLATGQVTTLAGAKSAGHEDGVGDKARFYRLPGLTHRAGAASDTLYVVEASGELEESDDSFGLFRLGWGSVRRLQQNSAGAWEVKTLAGTFGSITEGSTGEADGFGPFARLLDPRSVAVWQDVLFVGQGASVRSVSLTTGQVATAAGVLVEDFTSYNVRAVSSVQGVLYVGTHAGDLLELPVASSRPSRRLSLCPDSSNAAHVIRAITADASAVYVYDASRSQICRVDLEGKLGKPCCAGCTETCELVVDLSDKRPWWNVAAMAYDGSFFYVTDQYDNQILRIDPRDNTYRRLELGVSLDQPWGIVAAGGALYVAVTQANAVLRVDPKTGATQLLGNGLPRSEDGKAETASICHPTALASDGTRLFVAETHCAPDLEEGTFHGHAIRQVDLKSGEVSTLMGPGPKPYVVEGAGGLGSLNRASAMTYDKTTEALYVADRWDNVLLRVD